MKTFKISIQSVLILSLVLVLTVTVVITKSQNKSGYSSATKCSPTARQWIVEKFGDAENIEELLFNINSFIGTRTYIDKPFLIQYFNMDEFITNNCDGLCYDWACATSIIVREISIEKGWKTVTPLVVDATSLNGEGRHSFNFVVVDDNRGKRTYYIDTTFDNTRRKKGEKPVGIIEIGNLTIEEFSKKICQYRIDAYH